jgi:WD40 repeat protein
VYYKAGSDITYSLLKSFEYEVIQGQLKLKIKTSTTVALRTPYTAPNNGSLKIIASGYEDNTHPIANVMTGVNAIKIENSTHQDNNPITELNLNGAKVYVILGNTLEFENAILDVANFTLSHSPVGTSISSVEYNDSTSAIVTLSYDGTDFDTNAQVNVTVNKN